MPINNLKTDKVCWVWWCSEPSKCVRSIMSVNPLTYFVFVIGIILASVDAAQAQMAPLLSVRYGLTSYSKDLKGLYFAMKDPEEQEITIGGVVVRAGLGVKQTYSNNITLAEREEKKDFITDVAPALMFEVPYRRHTFSIEYLGVLTYYRDNSSFDTNNHFVQARAQLLGLRDTVQINVKHIFGLFSTPTEDIPNAKDEEAEVLNRRRRLNFYQSGLNVLYKKNLFSVYLDYSNEINSFHRDIDKRDDLDNHRTFAVFGYNVRPKTRLLIGHTFEYGDGPNKGSLPSIDHTEQGVIYGIELLAMRKIEAEVRGSYNWINYTDLGIKLSYPGAWANVTYRPFERCALYLSFQRMTKPSFFYTGERERGGFFYIETRGTASVEYKVRRNVLVWSSLLYRNFRYPKQFRRIDDQYGGIVQVIYSMRPWLRLSAVQGYTINHSTLVDQDFEEMRTQFQVQCAF